MRWCGCERGDLLATSDLVADRHLRVHRLEAGAQPVQVPDRHDPAVDHRACEDHLPVRRCQHRLADAEHEVDAPVPRRPRLRRRSERVHDEWGTDDGRLDEPARGGRRLDEAARPDRARRQTCGQAWGSNLGGPDHHAGCTTTRRQRDNDDHGAQPEVGASEWAPSGPPRPPDPRCPPGPPGPRVPPGPAGAGCVRRRHAHTVRRRPADRRARPGARAHCADAAGWGRMERMPDRVVSSRDRPVPVDFACHLPLLVGRPRAGPPPQWSGFARRGCGWHQGLRPPVGAANRTADRSTIRTNVRASARQEVQPWPS